MADGPVSTAYESALAAGSHQPDTAQLAAVERLDELNTRFAARNGATQVGATQVGATLWSRILRMLPSRRREPVRGLYLWGTVGRGKTWLMDLFHDTLDTDKKRRVHFHRFMREVHRSLKSLGDVRDPLLRVADGIAADVDILCFDELFVSDIGDAMILGGLFEALFDRGVTLVATSNVPPSGLYEDGLQRARFLPAIAALERHTEVFCIGDGTDYRLRALERAALYHHPADEAADQRMADDFRNIAGTSGETDVRLEVEGRPIVAQRCADGVAWFDFDVLCDGPRGAADYIELARTFHTVMVSDVPGMDGGLENQARRFVALVDEFYDRRVKLVLTAAVPMTELYTGSRLKFEFQRTLSRLQEMQSREYLSAPHLG